jgi:type I restriction enzyme M protein
MVQMIDPQPHERIGDLAAGTCGFLINAYQHILEQKTSKDILRYDADGYAHNLVGDLLTDEEREFLQTKALRGFDNDSGMTMLRIGSMNLILHGVESPQFYYMDTLSKDFADTNAYDVILMNPPFKGGVDKNEVSPTLPSNVGKTELLFLHLILRTLDTGGRCAVIVPDGVLFGSSNAHKAIRKKILEENRLDGIVSMPGGVFKPYAGVSTAVLLFTKGASTGEEVWFYDMAHDGFSLDDKRLQIAENDIPDILECWRKRHDPAFRATQAAHLEQLRAEAAPLKQEWMQLQGKIDRLQFESVIAEEENTTAKGALVLVQQDLALIEKQLAPLQAQIAQLLRQFWVKQQEIEATNYELSVSRYTQIQPNDTFHEIPSVILTRLRTLEQAIAATVDELEQVWTLVHHP